VIHEAAVSALEPWVGRIVADTCVRATALASGKAVADLGVEDIPMLSANVQRLLGPIAPVSAVDSIVAGLEGLTS